MYWTRDSVCSTAIVARAHPREFWANRRRPVVKHEEVMKHSWLVLLPALGLATLDAQAQTWPSKPLKAIVPFAAGSLVDAVPRIVFEQPSTKLGQKIIVEIRPGRSI